MNNSKYYAIKYAKGIQNKIVRSWEECKQQVTGTTAIYKSFKSEIEAIQYLKSIPDKDVPKLVQKYEYIAKVNKAKQESIQTIKSLQVSKELYTAISNTAQKNNTTVEEVVVYCLKKVFKK